MLLFALHCDDHRRVLTEDSCHPVHLAKEEFIFRIGKIIGRLPVNGDRDAAVGYKPGAGTLFDFFARHAAVGHGKVALTGEFHTQAERVRGQADIVLSQLNEIPGTIDE